MEKSQAQDAAIRIKEYWANLGATVKVWVASEASLHRQTGPEDQTVEYTVRSDLVNGLPADLSPRAMKTLLRRQFEYSPGALARLGTLAVPLLDGDKKK